MALGVSFTSSFPYLPLFLISPSLSPSHGLYIVGRQHAQLASALHAPLHPTLVDGLHIYDHVSVHEGHLVVVGSGVVVQGSVPLLQTHREHTSHVNIDLLTRL